MRIRRGWPIAGFGIAVLMLTYLGAKTLRTMTVVDGLTSFRTDHFVISYRGVYQDEAEALAKTLEDNYERIRADLVDPKHDTIRVFIHPNQKDFNQGTGLVNSKANGTSRGPLAFHLIWTNWYNSIFPDDPLKTAIHEFTHCVQLNILIKQAQGELVLENGESFDEIFEAKFQAHYPQWFWEAICTYEANEINSISVKYGMRQNPTLKYLNNSNQVYNVGYTLIEYIVETWGKDKLSALITSYVDIENVLGLREEDFEKGWINFVNEKY